VPALYLDEDIKYDAVALLQMRGHGVVHARDHSKGSTDGAQLLVAARAGWIVVTCNQRDFLLLHDAWLRWSHDWGVKPEHSGILLVRNHWSAAQVTERVHDFFATPRPISNHLYRWINEQAWVQQPP
jgi:hypothetical protein